MYPVTYIYVIYQCVHFSAEYTLGVLGAAITQWLVLNILQITRLRPLTKVLGKPSSSTLIPLKFFHILAIRQL